MFALQACFERACLGILVCTSIGFAQSTLVGRMLAEQSSPDGRVVSDLERGLLRLEEKADPIVLRTLCEGLVREYPGRVRLEEYGLSSQGRPLNSLVVAPIGAVSGATLEGPEVDPPVALVLPALGQAPDPVGLLRQVEELLKEPAWQGNAEVWILPVPDPDRWVLGEPSEIYWQRNFPWRWSPWNTDGVNPGASPLCVAESKNLLHAMVGEPALMGVVELGASAGEGALAPPGSLKGYAREVLGLPWLELGESNVTVGLFALRERADGLEGRVKEVRRLAENRWCVDLELLNPAPGRTAGLGCELAWHAIGGKLLKACVGTDVEGEFRLLDRADGHRLPTAGTAYALRLVVESTGGETLFVRFESPRTQALEIKVPLGIRANQPR